MKYVLLVYRPELVQDIDPDADPFQGIEVAGIFDSESECERFMARNHVEHPDWHYLIQPEVVQRV